MKQLYKISPDGTRDMVFGEAERKIMLIDDLRVNYIMRGFCEILTPSVEFYDLFTARTNTVASELMFKMSDNKGRLIVFRPDNTAPIARVVSTRLQDAVLPLKLHYTQNVLRQQADLAGRPCEITQSGVEMIGSAGLRADIEILVTAHNALAISGAKFKLELSHVGFFNALAAKIPFEGYDYEEMRGYIEYKNHSALMDILSKYKSFAEAEALIELPTLFGGAEALERARSLTEDSEALACIDYLQQLYSGLAELGIEGCISFDLGIVQQLEYYSGLVFQGYADGVGMPVLSGGRYDNLYTAFGGGRPAIGFAIDVDALSEVAARADEERACSEVLIRYEKGCAKAAYKYHDKLLREGVFAEIDTSDALEDAKSYARAKGIKKLALITKSGVEEAEL